MTRHLKHRSSLQMNPLLLPLMTQEALAVLPKLSRSFVEEEAA